MRALSTACVVLLALSGCAVSHAPKDWLPRAVDATQEAHGGWILLRLADESEHSGELIAIRADSLFVLEADAFRGYAHVEVEHALLTGYDAEAGTIRAWMVIGSLSTLSHGYGLVISLPAWLLVGSVATFSQAQAGRVDVTQATWEKARLYARFPQGLPADLDPSSLRPRNPPVTRR